MESEDNDSTERAHSVSPATAGAQLRAARDGLRLDLAHIAAETRIPLRHLEAIEQGQFETLPSRAYAIGFSRTYAKAVGLDGAAITDAVRAELADGTMRRTAPEVAMEPGDPARLPSAGLAWAGAGAALVLAAGAFAFYNAYFAAGTEPGSLLPPPADEARPKAVAGRAADTDAGAPAAGRAVVLTALEDGIWVRLYQEGGERLLERTLTKGEAVTVPTVATDPRINTGRPDALAITVGGQAVAKLSERPITIAGAPVSASALLARAAPATGTPGAGAEPVAGPAAPSPAPRAVRTPQPRREPAPASEPAAAAPAPSEPASPASAEPTGN